MNRYMYHLLLKNVRYPTGERIVREHFQDFNAQQIFVELEQDNLRSTYGRIRTRTLRTYLSNLRLDNKWTKSTMEFILWFRKLSEELNRRQETLDTCMSDILLKTMLEQAVATHPALNAVTVRDLERDIGGEQPRFNYHQYLAALEAAATTFDTQKGRTLTPERRSIFNAETSNVDILDEYAALTNADPDEDYEAFVAATQPGPRLTQATYEELLPETRRIWRQLPSSEKTLLLKDNGRSHHIALWLLLNKN